MRFFVLLCACSILTTTVQADDKKISDVDIDVDIDLDFDYDYEYDYDSLGSEESQTTVIYCVIISAIILMAFGCWFCRQFTSCCNKSRPNAPRKTEDYVKLDEVEASNQYNGMRLSQTQVLLNHATSDAIKPYSPNFDELKYRTSDCIVSGDRTYPYIDPSSVQVQQPPKLAPASPPLISSLYTHQNHAAQQHYLPASDPRFGIVPNRAIPSAPPQFSNELAVSQPFNSVPPSGGGELEGEGIVNTGSA